MRPIHDEDARLIELYVGTFMAKETQEMTIHPVATVYKQGKGLGERNRQFDVPGETFGDCLRWLAAWADAGFPDE